jgi:YVTN family beta-propeller protein
MVELEEQLKLYAQDMLSRVEPIHPDEIIGPANQLPSPRRVHAARRDKFVHLSGRRSVRIAGMLVLAVSLAIGIGLLARGDRSPNPRHVNVAASGNAEVPSSVLGFAPQALTTGFGSLWAVGGGTADGKAVAELARIDPTNLRVTARIALPQSAVAITSDSRTVWVVTLQSGPTSTPKTDPSGEPLEGSLVAIDPHTNAIARTLALPSPGQIAVSPGAVWVTDPRLERVYRIDPNTMKVVATIPVHGAGYAVSFGGNIWVSGLSSGMVSVLNPATNRVTGTIAVGQSPGEITASGQSLWILDDAASAVFHLDASKQTIIGKTSILGGRPIAMTSDYRNVWVAVIPAGVLHIDPTRASATPVSGLIGRNVVAFTPAGSASLWLVDGGNGQIERVAGRA